jgi:hypothetical protein
MTQHTHPRTLIVGILSLILTLLTGCNSIEIAGRVVSAPAGIPLVVPATDARIVEGQGVPGVRVDVLGEKGAVIATATSGPTGNFKLSMPSTGTPTGSVEVTARGSSIIPAKGTLYLPRDGSWILFNVQRNPTADAGDAPR